MNTRIMIIKGATLVNQQTTDWCFLVLILSLGKKSSEECLTCGFYGWRLSTVFLGMHPLGHQRGYALKCRVLEMEQPENLQDHVALVVPLLLRLPLIC